MTKRLFAFFAVFVFAVTMTVSAAEARISMGADVATWLMDVEEESTNDNGVGFGEPGANIHIYGDVASNVDAYVETQVMPTVSTGGDGNALEVEEAYITLDNLGPLELKVGNFEVDFGNRHLDRSNIADVQDNPLVHNDIVDVVAEESGLELSGEHAGGNFGWALGVTNGTGNASLNGDRGIAFIPKIWGNFGPGISTAFSYYTVDHTGSGSASTLLTATTEKDIEAAQSELISNGGFGLDQAGLGAVGGVTPNDVSAWQLDFGWEGQMAEVNAWWLSAEDEAPATAAELTSYGLEGVFNFTPSAYGAARYSVAVDDSSGAPNADQSDRLQVGMGYNLNENTLAKFEWVDQTNENPTGAPTDNGADGWIAELSVSF